MSGKKGGLIKESIVEAFAWALEKTFLVWLPFMFVGYVLKEATLGILRLARAEKSKRDSNQ